MTGLHVLPGQSEANVDGRHLATLAYQFSDQNRTVEAATGQDGDGAGYGHCT